jgi:UDP-N-acetylmuramoyl-tripeptide--D-alanyl-D-alanine ligase
MTVVLAVLALLATGFAGWRAVRRVRFFLHIFQLETYKFDRYGRWLAEHAGDTVVRLSHVVGTGLLAVGAAGFSLADPWWTAAGLLPAWALTFISSRRYRSDQAKKPLAYTARMIRLAIPTGILTAAPVILGATYGWMGGDPSGVFWYLLGFLVADLGAPLWVGAAAVLMQPVESAIQEGFKRDARAKLRRRSDLTVIGITGSYGKTSTKFILAEILRQKYSVYATPSSYNTPMGMCLAVNEKLKPEHQILVLEYGIRYPGDIKELCDIARPDVSVITTVGLAHLETMGSIEAIAEEKGSLLQYMRPDGPSVLNVDNEHVERMQARAPGPVWRVSVDGHPKADLTARNVSYDTDGASFVVQDDTGAEAEFQTQLLGEHNVLNILLAVAVGRTMGLRLRQMAHAVRRIEPVEHRLQLRRRGDVTIIDDAFNSNPVGARNAIDILGQMRQDGEGRRIIVTPGMVELGDRQWEENNDLGAYIARSGVDLAVLVGDQQTEPLQAGLRDAGYPEEQTKVFNSLFDAQDFLKSYLQPGDVVLYENDLPDQYQ